MRNFAKGTWIAGILLAIGCQTLCAQQLTLRDAIRIAQENSLDAKVARFSFLANYWTYRSFKAQLLPSVNLSGGLGNFNRSLVQT